MSVDPIPYRKEHPEFMEDRTKYIDLDIHRESISIAVLNSVGLLAKCYDA